MKARVYRGGPVVAASTTALTVGTRYHVGFTVSGTTLTIYVNGVAEGTVPATGSFDGYSNPNLRLAGRVDALEESANTTRAHGDYVQLGEWNVPLTASQMLSLANGATPNTVQSGALVLDCEPDR